MRKSFPNPTLTPAAMFTPVKSGLNLNSVSGLIGIQPPFVMMTSKLSINPVPTISKDSSCRLNQMNSSSTICEPIRMTLAQKLLKFGCVTGIEKANSWGTTARNTNHHWLNINGRYFLFPICARTMPAVSPRMTAQSRIILSRCIHHPNRVRLHR